METISIDLDQTWIRPSNSTKKKKKGKKLSVKIIRFDQVDEKCSIVVLSLYRARMNKKKKKKKIMLLLLQDGARKSQTPSTLSTKNTTMTVPQLRASRIAIVSNPFSAVGRERTKFFMRHLVCSRTYMYMYVCVYAC